jgi:hypothetical protein
VVAAIVRTVVQLIAFCFDSHNLKNHLLSLGVILVYRELRS